MRIVRYDDGKEFKREKDMALLVAAMQSFTVSEIDNMKSTFTELENDLDEHDISYVVYNKFRFFNLYSFMYTLHVLIFAVFVNVYVVYLFPLGLYIGLVSLAIGIFAFIPTAILHMKVFSHVKCELIKKGSQGVIEVLFRK